MECRVLGGEMTCDGNETLELRYFQPDSVPPLFCAPHERLLWDVR